MVLAPFWQVEGSSSLGFKIWYEKIRGQGIRHLAIHSVPFMLLVLNYTDDANQRTSHHEDGKWAEQIQPFHYGKVHGYSLISTLGNVTLVTLPLALMVWAVFG